LLVAAPPAPLDVALGFPVIVPVAVLITPLAHELEAGPATPETTGSADALAENSTMLEEVE
jgi:hypothetical protein